MTRILQLADHVELALGRDSRAHVGDPDARCDRGGRSGVVPGEENGGESEAHEPRDGVATRGLDDIADDEHPARRAVPCGDDGRRTGCLGGFDRRGEVGRHGDRPLGEKPFRASDHHEPAVDDRLHSPLMGLERLGGAVEDDSPGCGLGGDRPRDRVFGAVLCDRGEAKEIQLEASVGGGIRSPGVVSVAARSIDAGPAGHDDAGDGHHARGEGARLVEHDRIDAAGLLEHLGAAQQDAELRASTGSDEERRRSGESEGTGARDDERRDGGREGHVEGGPEDRPGQEGRDREADDDGHEDGGDPVGDALHVRLAGLCLLHEAAQARELGIRPDPGDLHDEASARVDGRPDDAVADRHLHRNRFAREQARVHSGCPVDDDPVGRDLLARTDDEPVAGDERRDCDRGLDAPAQECRLARAELEQGPHRGTRLALGPGFEVAAREDEYGDSCGDLEVDVVRSAPGGRDELEGHGHSGLARHAEEEGVERPAEGRDHPDADERVHRRGTVPGVDEGGAVERQRPPHRDRSGEGEGEPLPVRELDRRDHRQGDDRHGQHERDHEAAEEGIRF